MSSAIVDRPAVMSRSRRATGLSLKLDVIVEEGYRNQLVHTSNLTNEDVPFNFPSTRNTTTCTVTLTNSDQSHENDSQFLHTGRWPSMYVADEAIKILSKQVDTSGTKIEDSTILTATTEVVTVEDLFPIKSSTDVWEIIQPDQLSMVIDYWYPNNNTYPLPQVAALRIAANTSSMPDQDPDITTLQQSLFVCELMEEYLTRTQTVQHIEELEDNDSAIEIVATLEGYRQNGWAEEMIKAFPRECWLFWTSSGLDSTEHVDDDYVC